MPVVCSSVVLGILPKNKDTSSKTRQCHCVCVLVLAFMYIWELPNFPIQVHVTNIQPRLEAFFFILIFLRIVHKVIMTAVQLTT